MRNKHQMMDDQMNYSMFMEEDDQDGRQEE